MFFSESRTLASKPYLSETKAPDAAFSHGCNVIPYIAWISGEVHLSLETSKESREDTDQRLAAYFHSADEEESQEHLEYLLEIVARPVINRIVQRSARLNVSSGYESSPQDIVGEALLRVLTRLRASKADTHHQLISNFGGLVATITYRAIADHVRARHRQRANLERKVRRLFAANGNLGIWKDSEKNLVCGYVVCRGTEAARSGRVDGYPTPAELSVMTAEVRTDPQKRNTAELILLLLNKIQQPVRFRDFMELISELVASQCKGIEVVDSEQPLALTQDEHASSSSAAENRVLLERLFAEILKLGVEQRKSLLLNMTDSYGYSIEWFVFTGIATEAELASLLELSVDEFRQLLNDLPMTDKEIAKQLGVSSTRVANIRKAVRDRLARCRQAFLRGKKDQ